MRCLQKIKKKYKKLKKSWKQCLKITMTSLLLSTWVSSILFPLNRLLISFLSSSCKSIFGVAQRSEVVKMLFDGELDRLSLYLYRWKTSSEGDKMLSQFFRHFIFGTCQCFRLVRNYFVVPLEVSIEKGKAWQWFSIRRLNHNWD